MMTKLDESHDWVFAKDYFKTGVSTPVFFCTLP
jgi:hypothetical protein